MPNSQEKQIMIQSRLKELVRQRKPHVIGTHVNADVINISRLTADINSTLQRKSEMQSTTVRNWVNNTLQKRDDDLLDAWCRYLECDVGDLLYFTEDAAS